MNKKFISEIFLNSSYVSKESWNKFLSNLTNYIGYFKSWELCINIEMNECRYYIISPKIIPSNLGDSPEFFMKSTNVNPKIRFDIAFIGFISIKSNFFEIYDKKEINDGVKLKQILIKFRIKKLSTYSSNTKYIFEDRNTKILCVTPFSIPTNVLSVNYDNSRFFYRKKPKYLNIQKSLHLLKGEPSNSVLKVDTFPYLVGDYYLNQNSYNYFRHSIIVGGSGTGKSKLMSLFINNLNNNNDSKLKYRVVVIDPHASLVDDIGGLNNIKILDYLSVDSSANITSKDDNDIASSVENIMFLFKNLMKEQYNSKIERILRYTVNVLLISKDFSFFNMRRLILDIDYRSELINKNSKKIQEAVLDFFMNDFNELKTRSYTESISPIVSFVDELLLLPGFDKKNESIELKDIIKDNFVTLFSLDKNKIGENSTKIIVNLALSKIFELVSSKTFEENIILMIDEISNVETPIISRILSEARKYNLSLTIATQYFNQISGDLRKSIFSNVVNYYIFRVSKEDARLLEENLLIKMDEDILENRVKLLSELGDRECVVRVLSNDVLLPALKAKTMDFNPIPRRELKVKENNNVIDVNSNHNILKRPFNIKSRIKLNDIMIEQSTSRRKVR